MSALSDDDVLRLARSLLATPAPARGLHLDPGLEIADEFTVWVVAINLDYMLPHRAWPLFSSYAPRGWVFANDKSRKAEVEAALARGRTIAAGASA